MEKAYPKEVQEIHNSILNVFDDLMCNVKKGGDLKALGFNSNPEVENVKIHKAIEKYKLKYPTHKFVTDDIITKVCKKYKLVHGEIGKFIGFVPAKNVEEIKKFNKAFNLDFTDGSYKINYSGGSWFNSEPYHTSNNWYSKSEIKERFNLNNKNIEHIKSGKHFGLTETLTIAAPVTMFDTKDMTVKKGKLVKNLPPDPIVLQEVPEGYLVVTAWGDESQDPEIFNENQN